MTLSINVAAIAHNAGLVRERAERSGLNVTAVIKDPFAIPGIIDAILSSGIHSLGLSSAKSGGALRPSGRSHCEFIGLALPDQAPAIIQHMDASMHTCLETISAFASAAEATHRHHSIWIGILSSDDREGVAADELAMQLVNWNHHLGNRLVLEGLFAHWGCHFEAPPKAQEIRAVFEAAAELGERIRRAPFAVSLGGSVLLPVLDRILAPPRTQLRVGEAILAGTIPGCDNHGLELQEPFSIDTRVIEASVRRVEGVLRPRILVDCGASVLDYRDIRPVDLNGKPLWSSSGMTAVQVLSGQSPRIGDIVRFGIGYRSALRVLSNSSVNRVERDLTEPRPPSLASGKLSTKVA